MTGTHFEDRRSIDAVGVGVVRRLQLQPSEYARYFGGVACLAAAYYAAAQLGFTLRFTGPVAAIVWLPVGVAIAFLYIGGLQLWPPQPIQPNDSHPSSNGWLDREGRDSWRESLFPRPNQPSGAAPRQPAPAPRH